MLFRVELLPLLVLPRPFVIKRYRRSRPPSKGVPNQLYSQGMYVYPQWEKAKKFFSTMPGSKHHDLLYALTTAGQLVIVHDLEIKPHGILAGQEDA